MSLRQVWEFRCDGCGIRRYRDGWPYDGKPTSWSGPENKDGKHLCEVCQERGAGQRTDSGPHTSGSTTENVDA